MNLYQSAAMPLVWVFVQFICCASSFNTIDGGYHTAVSVAGHANPLLKHLKFAQQCLPFLVVELAKKEED